MDEAPQKRQRLTPKSLHFELLPLQALVNVILFSDEPTLYTLPAVNRLLQTVLESVFKGTALETKLTPLEQLDKQNIKPEKVKRKWRRQYTGKCTDEQFELLVHLAIVDAKLQHAERCGVEGVGGITCTERTYSLIPPGFVLSIYKASMQLLENFEGASLELQDYLATTEMRMLQLFLRDQKNKEIHSVDELYGKDLIGANDYSETYYNAKQDLLNRIVDNFDDQFVFCSKLYKCSISKAPLVVKDNKILLLPCVQSLLAHGFCVIDNFVSDELSRAVNQLCQTCVDKSSAGEEDEGSQDAFMQRGTPVTARGDLLAWLDDDNPPANTPPLSHLVDRYRLLQKELSCVVALQGGKESQMAYYPDKGKGYRRHRDTVPDDGSTPSDNRRVTAITYCNPDWESSHGGKLRVWLGSIDEYKVIEVEPLSGRMVLFMSGMLDHEVRPSFAPRVAVTTWYW